MPSSFAFLLRIGGSFLVSLACCNAPAQPPGRSALPDEAESSAIDRLRTELQLAKLRARSVGPKHPQYEQIHRRLRELESQLHARGGAVKGSADAPADSVAGQEGGGPPDDSKPDDTVDVRPPDPIKTPLSARAFELVGGWLLPSEGAGGRGLGFAKGGMFVEQGSGKDRLLYLYGHQQSKECHVMSVSLDRFGRDPEERSSWPTARPVKLLKKTHDIPSNRPYNLCRPNPGGQFLTTGRVLYATEPSHWKGPWMNWYDERDGGLSPVEVERSVDRRQVYGGGFCDIPEWFAEGYLDGRDFGVGYGGYRSGQGSSPGPTLFAADRPQDGAATLTRCINLLSFPWKGERHQREQRPGDYTKPLWGPPAEGDQGWWQADEIVAGPVWIDTERLTGLCYWSVQGIGKLNYNLQNKAFSNERRVRLYIYDPAQFVQVVRGERKPYQVRGSHYEWELPFAKGENSKRWPIGAYWDPTDRMLYMAYRASGGGKYEVPPAVVAYKVAP